MPRTPAQPRPRAKPAAIVYFHKGKRAVEAVAATVTQTFPEIDAPAVDDDEKTEPAARVAAAPEARRPRRRTSREIPQVKGLAEASPTPIAQPQPVADLAMFGHQLFELGRLDEARVIFEGLVRTDPRDAFAHAMLGTIYLARGDLERALALFQATLAVDPLDLAALVYRAEIRLNLKKPREAVADLQTAIAHGARGDPFVDRARRLLKLARASAPRKMRSG